MPIRLQADADFNQIIVSASPVVIRKSTSRPRRQLVSRVSRTQTCWRLPRATAASSSRMTTRHDEPGREIVLDVGRME